VIAYVTRKLYLNIWIVSSGLNNGGIRITQTLLGIAKETQLANSHNGCMTI
jgi:hypothetical protein